MTVQAGRDVLIKLENERSFTAIAGIRAKSIQMNAAPIDATHGGSPSGWRELLSGAGVKSVRVSGTGVFRDEVSDSLMREAFLARETRRWQLIMPDFARFEGPFLISQLSYAGDFDGEATFTLSLESAGEILVTEI